jgi:hypothetical protein
MWREQFRMILLTKENQAADHLISRLVVIDPQVNVRNLKIGYYRFLEKSDGEEQYQAQGSSCHGSDVLVLAGLCARASWENSLSGHGSSRSIFDCGRES